MIDPRPAVIATRLAPVKRVIAVTGGKGGIGKSFVASTLALGIAAEGRRAGLLDLDFTGPCDHLFLGVDRSFPEEKHGILAPEVHGVSFMSITFFSGAHAAPLRGGDMTDAIIELLAITRWEELDTLVLDMPPGIGDATLDVLRLIPRVEFVAVSTPSRIVVDTVRRTLELLNSVEAPVLGVVANMERGDGDAPVQALAGLAGVPYLGAVPFDPGVEAAAGDPPALLATDAGVAVRGVAKSILHGGASS